MAQKAGTRKAGAKQPSTAQPSTALKDLRADEGVRYIKRRDITNFTSGVPSARRSVGFLANVNAAEAVEVRRVERGVEINRGSRRQPTWALVTLK